MASPLWASYRNDMGKGDGGREALWMPMARGWLSSDPEMRFESFLTSRPEGLTNVAALELS